MHTVLRVARMHKSPENAQTGKWIPVRTSLHVPHPSNCKECTSEILSVSIDAKHGTDHGVLIFLCSDYNSVFYSLAQYKKLL
jgi:hypothetical protein